MKKAEKVQLVSGLSSTLSKATSIVLVNFSGLTVSKQQQLKKRLKEIDSEMIVVKNTLLKLAGKGAKLDEKTLTDEVLSGQTALIITTGDAIAPIQVIGKFAKEFQVPQFKVGIVEGNFQDQESLTKLSLLPGKSILLSQLVGTLSSPTYGLVNVLQGNMQKLIYILKTKAGD